LIASSSLFFFLFSLTESPSNLERWRKLAGTDPKPVELFDKIRALEERLSQKEASFHPQEFSHDSSLFLLLILILLNF
jgi:hypothetical protein